MLHSFMYMQIVSAHLYLFIMEIEKLEIKFLDNELLVLH